MIVWSLDNRFVLAAIMDFFFVYWLSLFHFRICVWNASDGSLVHSLTGISASTYVLDVHPFNPRIAMSAGYDGKTIIWDIWEGTPIRIYETGPYKLVDGKFSPNKLKFATNINMPNGSEIYLLNTGQGDPRWMPNMIQFFLGDYRPLIHYTHGNVVDQVCFHLTDVIFWEPENDLIDDDTDSEYNATAEYCIAVHNGSLSESSSSDSVFSGEDMSGPQKKKRVSDVDAMTSPKRHAKKRIMNEQDASSSRSRRTKKTRTCRKTLSKKKNVTARSLRPKQLTEASFKCGYILHSSF
ncbi:hypothetical protein Leryth_013883 [Lithospermum erythrorhizon]|nr:hypothetical protein Leryth_013883 [Lithospermum erythrorhizon]